MASMNRMYKKYKKPAKKWANRIGKFAKGASGVVSKVSGLVKSVGVLKSLINAEKKYILNPTVSSVPVGQTAGNGDAIYIQDVTPLVPIGAGQSERTGSSIKMTSCRFRCQIQAMKGLISKQRVTIELWRSTGASQPIAGTGGATVTQQLYNADSITGLYDYFATRNTDFYHNFSLVKRFTRTVYPAQLDPSTTNPDLQPRFADVIASFRYPHHIRYNYNSTDVAQGQIFMVVRCDTGNTSATVPSTAIPNIVNQQVNSGSVLSANFFWHYLDN